MSRCAVAVLALALCGPALAQQSDSRRLPGSIALGPRLLDYDMQCVADQGCGIECFQHGVKILSRSDIGVRDAVRLMASAGADDQLTPRWLEIRPVDGKGVQTLLLTADTFCALNSLVISPKNRQ